MNTDLLHDIIPEDITHICETNAFGQCKKGYKYICKCCGFGNKSYLCSNEYCFDYKLYLFKRNDSHFMNIDFHLEDEDFDHLFENYTFDNIEDNTFHKIRVNYLNAKAELQKYIKTKIYIEKEEFKLQHYHLSDTYNETNTIPDPNQLTTRIKYNNIEKPYKYDENSAFAKPCFISDDLAIFLNLPIGSKIQRIQVSQQINKYIKEHNLQDINNGRKIIPDEKLERLCNFKNSIDKENLTYFNLQKYLFPHFKKNIKKLNI